MDLRALFQKIRPDFDLATPGLREAWDRGDRDQFLVVTLEEPIRYTEGIASASSADRSERSVDPRGPLRSAALGHEPGATRSQVRFGEPIELDPDADDSARRRSWRFSTSPSSRTQTESPTAGTSMAMPAAHESGRRRVLERQSESKHGDV